jgi:hypothetical protein
LTGCRRSESAACASRSQQCDGERKPHIAERQTPAASVPGHARSIIRAIRGKHRKVSPIRCHCACVRTRHPLRNAVATQQGIWWTNGNKPGLRTLLESLTRRA